MTTFLIIKNCLNTFIQKMCFLYRTHLTDGAHGISNVLEQFSIKYGIYTNIGSSKKDEISIWRCSTKSSEAGKKAQTFT